MTESIHPLVALRPIQLTMDEADPELVQLRALQLFMNLRGPARPPASSPSISGQTTYSCRPCCSRHGETPSLLSRMRTGDARRHDPLPARRQIGHAREIEITKLREAQTARNRRGRHHKHMRGRSRCSANFDRWATPNLCCSSITARPSFAKVTPSWITDCVPTTRSSSPRASWSGSPVAATPSAAREQRSPHPAAFEVAINRPPVLRGQEFRRRHQHGLSPRRDRHEHGINRHHGFPCANVG